jgi:hypothetical protein
MITERALLQFVTAMVEEQMTLRLFGSLDSSGDPIELRGGGYAPQGIAPNEWTIEMSASREAARADVQRSFVFDGSERMDVRGAYVTAPDGRTLWREAFDSVIKVGRKGDTIPVRPVINFSAVRR